MQYEYKMPFGAEVSADGTTRFRIWAPSAENVEILVNGGICPMVQLADGWFEKRIAAGAGTRYRYRINGAATVPDPASRCNPDDVHGNSLVVDPTAFEWKEADWRGRPWTDAVIYELHVGAFSPEGTFAGVEKRLDYLVELGITAVELMPIADFAGRRNWGYDGVLPFSPDASYGAPNDLKRLIDAAHARGLMVFLDVVYNHFGPDGNFLHTYAEPFFNENIHTPWGAALNFDGPGSAVVSDFFISNALYWLEEYRFDGLRLDAVHAIMDTSSPHFVSRLSKAVRCGPGLSREIHLILENDKNEASRLTRSPNGRPLEATAQWADDLHHAYHVLLTGEKEGYYGDYADEVVGRIGRTLAEGFGYQGEFSPHQGQTRGESSTNLPAYAFVSCLQNHDQVGNRAFGERLSSLAHPEELRAITAVFLLSPQIPMLFMGEEFAASSPFLYFCDFGGALGDAVREGRRKEFRHFKAFKSGQGAGEIPDPTAEETFSRSRLVLNERETAEHRDWLMFYQKLLQLRREHIIPVLDGIRPSGTYELHGESAVQVVWRFQDSSKLSVVANLSAKPVLDGTSKCSGTPFFSTHVLPSGRFLPPWSVTWAWTEQK
ncbi:MAG: Malto-oligosyltrehalose trehalohydrolase [Bradyrhizobium sp.]|nr:Malto-oligosyltrehalose trehalohydrolase [Bradyrhizobium sp.]